jgi:uncharacterized phage infection (PIP) family protein YhgE
LSVPSRPASINYSRPASIDGTNNRNSTNDDVFRKVSTSAKDELDAAVDELSSLSVKVNAELDETLQEQIKLNNKWTRLTSGTKG